MENFYELKGLTYTIDKMSVLKAIDCYEDSPVFEEVSETYDEIFEMINGMVQPVGILGFGTMPESIETRKYRKGTSIVYAVTSIGDELKQESTKAFAEGDYVKGMLCDAMADEALFSMENQILDQLKEACKEHKMGVLARLEAPHDIPIECQKEAWQYLELKKRFGIEISSGLMFDPVKTSCHVFVLTEDEESFKAEHDCRKCPNIRCRRRNVPDTEVIVHRNGQERMILVHGGENLLDALIRHNYYVTAVCGGKGRCGKCRVQVVKGNTFITDEDKSVFSQKEIDAGWRLSCNVYPTEELEIVFDQRDESEFEILAEFQGERMENAHEDETYVLAVDIGTTTIAMELLGEKSGNAVHTVTMVNGQRVYGADVISRMKASMDGKKEALRECIRRDLETGVSRLTEEAGIDRIQIRRIVISGNTTMEHLLMGYDCSTLGVFPFTPVNIDFIQKDDREILGSGTGIQTTLLPGISTYVGGDIVSGLYACGFEEKDEICLLVDLGTNGEMALGNKDKILVTSTAAGPAFEGGNIAWGMGSVAGAICSVDLAGTEIQVKTIHDRAAEGICGTGVVEATAELVKEGLISDAGTLTEKYFDSGFPLAQAPDKRKIVFTQKDIREIQLAKAAIRAGVEILLLRYGIQMEEVSKVYLAGGFGYRLDTEKAIAIGMLPKAFSGRIEAIGNSSLAGAVKYLKTPQARQDIQNILSVCCEISLSSDKKFNECYMDSMFFEAY